jgi:hypothetical protein
MTRRALGLRARWDHGHFSQENDYNHDRLSFSQSGSTPIRRRRHSATSMSCAGHAIRLSIRRGISVALTNSFRQFSTKLAAADALHLASALAANVSLLTFDERLRDAAGSKNLATIVVPEQLHTQLCAG